MITIQQWPDELTRTQENNCRYEAEAVIDGERYSVRARRGAPFALARVLIAAGIPDQPVSVAHSSLRGAMTYRRLHRMAELTVKESAGTPVRLGRYEERPAFLSGEPQNGGSVAPIDVVPIQTPELTECGACGQRFRPLREWSRYCSPRCKQRAKRARREAADAPIAAVL